MNTEPFGQHGRKGGTLAACGLSPGCRPVGLYRALSDLCRFSVGVCRTNPDRYYACPMSTSVGLSGFCRSPVRVCRDLLGTSVGLSVSVGSVGTRSTSVHFDFVLRLCQVDSGWYWKWTGTSSLRSTSGPALVRSTTGPLQSHTPYQTPFPNYR